MTLHAGLLHKHIPNAMKRKMGIVSRGGAIMAEWMMENKAENPLYTHWDEVMDILAEHDVTVSLGDGLRPGCLADASDAAQFGELDVLGELVERCRARGVQTMVEGPGHVPFDQIQMNMERQQEVCKKAPFYVLGPVTTDIAPGYDHIVSAIGATAAATYGASLLCYVTPAEHLGLPDAEEVHQGCMERATATTRWRTRARRSTGTDSSRSASTRSGRGSAGSGRARSRTRRTLTTTARCAASSSARCAPRGA